MQEPINKLLLLPMVLIPDAIEIMSLASSSFTNNEQKEEPSKFFKASLAISLMACANFFLSPGIYLPIKTFSQTSLASCSLLKLICSPFARTLVVSTIYQANERNLQYKSFWHSMYYIGGYNLGAAIIQYMYLSKHI